MLSLSFSKSNSARLLLINMFMQAEQEGVEVLSVTRNGERKKLDLILPTSLAASLIGPGGVIIQVRLERFVWSALRWI